MATPGRAEIDSTYLEAVKQELVRLELHPRCDERSRECFARMANPLSPENEFEVIIRVSPETATVHMFLEPFVHIESPGGLTFELARTLLELSAQLVTAKLEWRSGQNAVVLSTFVGTDSNFDRAAFRAQLLALIEAGGVLRPKILPLLLSPRNEEPRKPAS